MHREIQPDSCVWCDSVSRWRLAGSQTWARKGTDAALSYNLRYAAPEVTRCLAWETHFECTLPYNM